MRNGLLAQIRLDTALDAEAGQLICICRNVLPFGPQRQQAEKQCEAGAGGDRNGVELDAPRLAIELDVDRRTSAGPGSEARLLSLRASGGLSGREGGRLLWAGAIRRLRQLVGSGRGSSFAVSGPLLLSGLMVLVGGGPP